MASCKACVIISELEEADTVERGGETVAHVMAMMLEGTNSGVDDCDEDGRLEGGEGSPWDNSMSTVMESETVRMVPLRL